MKGLYRKSRLYCSVIKYQPYLPNLAYYPLIIVIVKGDTSMGGICSNRETLEELLKITLENIEVLEKAIKEIEEDLKKIYDAQEKARACIKKNA
ncbi:MAG: hypothetical protein QXU60_02495 [Sulfolobales archaeon]